MCGRFALDQDLDDLIREFVVQENRFPDWYPHFNMAPTSTIPIVLERQPGIREVGPARWSLTPRWSKELVLKYPTFNARSETAAEKPTFRDSVKTHRCIVPMTGYYEWSVINGTKAPSFVHRKDGAPFACAGLYSWWSDSETNHTMATATILTMESTGSLAPLHDRMPVIVSKESFSTWLDPLNPDGASLIHDVVDQTRSHIHEWEYYQVAPLRGDGPHLIERLERTEA